MAIDFERGPVELLIIEEILPPLPDPDFAAFVGDRLAAIIEFQSPLEVAHRTMAEDLEGAGVAALGVPLERAAAEHVSQVGAPPPTFDAERERVDGTAAELAGLADRLPPDGSTPPAPQSAQPGDQFTGVDGPINGNGDDAGDGGQGGQAPSGGDGPAVDPNIAHAERRLQEAAGARGRIYEPAWLAWVVDHWRGRPGHSIDDSVNAFINEQLGG